MSLWLFWEYHPYQWGFSWIDSPGSHLYFELTVGDVFLHREEISPHVSRQHPYVYALCFWCSSTRANCRLVCESWISTLRFACWVEDHQCETFKACFLLAFHLLTGLTSCLKDGILYTVKHSYHDRQDSDQVAPYLTILRPHGSCNCEDGSKC